jgi:hypothetical protein
MGAHPQFSLTRIALPSRPKASKKLGLGLPKKIIDTQPGLCKIVLNLERKRKDR